MSPRARPAQQGPESLRSRAAELRRLAAELEAEASELATPAAPADEALDLVALGVRYGFTRQSLRSAAKTGLRVFRGPRNKLTCFRSDVDSWIRSRCWTPRSRPAESDDEALARAEQEIMARNGLGTRSQQPNSAGSASVAKTSPVGATGNQPLTALPGGRR